VQRRSSGAGHALREGGSDLSKRLPRVLVVGVSALVVAAFTAPASGAVSIGHKPTPKTMLAKGTSAKVAAAADEGGHGVDADEAESVKLRAEYEQSITSAPGVSAPAAGLVAAQAQAAALPNVGGRWDQVTDKPFLDDPINRGANFGVGWGYITGRMTALTHAGSVIYAGAASGGVWRSTNGGVNWSPVSTGLPRLSVGALATNPVDGSVWVGTGEANNASENQYGVGVFRLAKGSSTWQKVGGSELYGAGSFRIAWVNGFAYVATSHGLWRRAANAAASTPWQLVLAPAGVKDYPPSSSVTDIIAVPGSGGAKILAVVGWAGYSVPPATGNNGFYVGSGAPGSFSRITPTGDINPNEIGRTTLSTSGGWLYAVVQDTVNDDLRGEGVFVSKSGRPVGPWTLIADTDKLFNSQSALGDSHSSYYPGIQSDYNQNILADPNDRQHVYLLLEEVFESTNGGKTWLAVGPYWNFDIPCNPDGNHPYSCPPTTHPDQHAAMIFGGKFWSGSDGGLWKRPLGWHLRGKWANLNKTLYTLQDYSVAVGKTPDGLAYWSGTQDNGEPFTTTSMPLVEQAFTGDGGDTIVDPSNGLRAVEEYVYLDMYLTTDGATNTLREISPSCLTATDPPKNCDPNPRFIAPIEMDVNNTKHWVAGGQYVWNDTKAWNTVCSGSEGCDWKKVYDTGTGHSVTALAANGNVTYAAWCGSCNPPDFARGMATNYGGTWHKLNLAGVPNRYITSIAVDKSNAAHVYISVGSYSRRWIPNAGYGHVFESTNGGATWKDVSGNLPDAPVYKVAFAGGNLVAGTEVGAFVAPRTTGQPLAWARLGSGLPSVTVWDIAVRGNLIVAGTHGRGNWEVKLN
jgi:hypothetical protein